MNKEELELLNKVCEERDSLRRSPKAGFSIGPIKASTVMGWSVSAREGEVELNCETAYNRATIVMDREFAKVVGGSLNAAAEHNRHLNLLAATEFLGELSKRLQKRNTLMTTKSRARMAVRAQFLADAIRKSLK